MQSRGILAALGTVVVTAIVVLLAATISDIARPHIALAQDGSISGTVTDESTNDPLSGIDVCAYEDPQDWDSSAGCDVTNGSGAYSVGGLPPGDYKVLFQDPAGTYAFEWYNDKSYVRYADLVSVSAGADTSGIDAALGAGGSISGTVTDESTTDPLAGVEVCPGQPGGLFRELWFLCDTTAASGAYSIGGLPSGDYIVEFYDASGAYATEWYDDQLDFPAGDLVSVTAGSDTGGINAALAPAGSISGTVTGEGMTDLAGIQACAMHIGTGKPWSSLVECGTTDGSGAYSVGRLGTGDYKVYFRDPTATYGFEWYNDKAGWESGDQVAVTAGVETSGIDAALPLAGSINGTVTDQSTAGPVSAIMACVRGPGPLWGSWPPHMCTTTDAFGAYSVGGLRPGDYIVRFVDWSGTYMGEWYDDGPGIGFADPVAVSAGSKTGSIDAALALAAVGGIAELPDVADMPLETPESAGPNAGVLAGIAAAVAAGVVALGGAAWYARRQW